MPPKIQTLLLILVSTLAFAQNNYKIEYEIRENSENGKLLEGVEVKIANPLNSGVTGKDGTCTFNNVTSQVQSFSFKFKNYRLFLNKRTIPNTSNPTIFKEIVILKDPNSPNNDDYLRIELKKLTNNATELLSKSQELNNEIKKVASENFKNYEKIESLKNELSLVGNKLNFVQSTIETINKNLINTDLSLNQIHESILKQGRENQKSDSILVAQREDIERQKRERKNIWKYKEKKLIVPTLIGVGAGISAFVYKKNYQNKLENLKFYIANNQNGKNKDIIRLTYDEIDRIKQKEWLYHASYSLAIIATAIDFKIILSNKPKYRVIGLLDNDGLKIKLSKK